MTWKELDNYLQSLTYNEKKYLEGFKPDIKNMSASFPLEQRTSMSMEEIEKLFADRGISVPDAIDRHREMQDIVIIRNERFLTIPAHTNIWVELNYVYSGKVEITLNDKSYTLTKGQIGLIDSDTPHSVSRCGEGDILINFVINKEYLNNNFLNRFSRWSVVSSFFIDTINSRKKHDRYLLFQAGDNPRIHNYIRDYLCEYYDPTLSHRDILNSLIILIFCELINVYESDYEKTYKDSDQGAVLSILRYIETNYKVCTLKSCAEYFNMHPNYLSQYLRKHTDRTYKSLVQEHRIKSAAKLLRYTDMTVSDIANDVGYENMSFFYKIFSQYYNCSPRDYRNIE